MEKTPSYLVVVVFSYTHTFICQFCRMIVSVIFKATKFTFFFVRKFLLNYFQRYSILFIHFVRSFERRGELYTQKRIELSQNKYYFNQANIQENNRGKTFFFSIVYTLVRSIVYLQKKGKAFKHNVSFRSYYDFFLFSFLFVYFREAQFISQLLQP